MVDVYLSQRVPRWEPATEQDIQSGLDRGLLAETHYLDLKAEIKTGSGGNNELARDLAQFALDGGTLLVGVAEAKDAEARLVPVELAGLKERLIRSLDQASTRHLR